MDYHPKQILVTCVYLACKVEEFNISIQLFVANINGDREKASDIILNDELLLMQQLNFHLTVHNSYRPVTSLLIDIKTRCSLKGSRPTCSRSSGVVGSYISHTCLSAVCIVTDCSSCHITFCQQDTRESGFICHRNPVYKAFQ